MPGPSVKQAANWEPKPKGWVIPKLDTGWKIPDLPRTPAPPPPEPEPFDLGAWLAAGGSPPPGWGGGGEAVEEAPPPPVIATPPIAWDVDPNYLAGRSALDQAEGVNVGGYRTRQDSVRRALADMLPQIADRAKKSRENVALGQEGRGLLRSGATERLLADVTSSEQSQNADANKQTADAVADLEQQIAQARATASQARADLAAKFASGYAQSGGV